MSDTEINPGANQNPKGGTLALTIKDRNVLYTTYMQFVKGGGLFIPTQKPYQLGQEVHMVLNLMEETEKFTVSGVVIWCTPSGAHNNRAPGVGVQLQGETGLRVRDRIETYLAGILNSDRLTHTL